MSINKLSSLSESDKNFLFNNYEVDLYEYQSDEKIQSSDKKEHVIFKKHKNIYDKLPNIVKNELLKIGFKCATNIYNINVEDFMTCYEMHNRRIINNIKSRASNSWYCFDDFHYIGLYYSSPYSVKNICESFILCGFYYDAIMMLEVEAMFIHNSNNQNADLAGLKKLLKKVIQNKNNINCNELDLTYLIKLNDIGIMSMIMNLFINKTDLTLSQYRKKFSKKYEIISKCITNIIKLSNPNDIINKLPNDNIKTIFKCVEYFQLNNLLDSLYEAFQQNVGSFIDNKFIKYISDIKNRQLLRKKNNIAIDEKYNKVIDPVITEKKAIDPVITEKKVIDKKNVKKDYVTVTIEDEETGDKQNIVYKKPVNVSEKINSNINDDSKSNIDNDANNNEKSAIDKLTLTKNFLSNMKSMLNTMDNIEPNSNKFNYIKNTINMFSSMIE